jgi:hypothetical protein
MLQSRPSVQKLNQYLSKHNQILFVMENYMFRHISGHFQVNNWSLKHTQGDVYIKYTSQYVLRTNCETQDDLR